MAGVVNELTSAQYTAQLVDEAGVNVPLIAIVSLTGTLYDELTGTIINGRDGQDILNAHDVVVSSTGFITWSVQPADNAIINDNLDTEVHTMLFQGVYSGAKELKHEFSWRVVNMEKVA